MSKPQVNRNGFEKSHGHQPSNSKGFNRRMSNGEKAKNGTAGNGSGSLPDSDVLHDPAFQAHQQDRLLFLIMNSIGAKINVTSNSSTTLTGILENIDPKTLKIVVKADGGFVTINYDDVVEFEIENIDLFNNNYTKNTGSFKTDTDISTKNTSGNRRQEIEKWVPDASTSSGLSLEDMTLQDGDNVKWDQFETNEQKFGIKSEFDEHFYTTRINKDAPDIEKRFKEAEKLAREIERRGTENSHLAEERGVVFDDSGLDEEDKYSGVTRKPSTAKGDALFASLINKGQDSKNLFFAADEKSKYVPPSQRNRLQNVDPAIISATTITKVPDAKVAAENKPPANPSLPPKPSIPAKPITNAPPHAVSSSDKKRAFEQVKKLNAMNEINSLKEFSQNFKIPGKFPQDLLPIITKDKSKQEEIIKKAEADSAKASPKAVAVIPKTASPSIVPSSTSAPTASTKSNTPATTQSSITKKPETVKHKLNPKAAAFTPSFTPSGFGSPAQTSVSPHFQKASPRLSQPVYRQKKALAGPFFSAERAPSAGKRRKSLGDDFNFFKGCYEEFKPTGPDSKFVLEKPFVTPPTWSRDDDERPFKSMFPDPSKLPPAVQPQQMPPYQPLPMIQAPQMFFGGPQFPGMRMSPQQPHPQPQPVMSPTDPNFKAQRMQPMYMQPGIPMNPGPIPYQRYAQVGYPGPPGSAPIPGMMPGQGGRMHTGYKNH